MLIEGYFNGNVMIDGKHNVSNLQDFLKSKKYLVDINTDALVREQAIDSPLFHNFVIEKDGYGSYKQVDVIIGYKADTGKLELLANYLFKETRITCDSVEDVKAALEKIDNMLS